MRIMINLWNFPAGSSKRLLCCPRHATRRGSGSSYFSNSFMSTPLIRANFRDSKGHFRQKGLAFTISWPSFRPYRSQVVSSEWAHAKPRSLISYRHSGYRAPGPALIPSLSSFLQSRIETVRKWQGIGKARLHSTSCTTLTTKIDDDTPNSPEHNYQPNSSVTSNSETWQTPAQQPRPEKQASEETQISLPPETKFWSHRLYSTATGQTIPIHYCRNLTTSEAVAQLFLHDNPKVVGLDLEWESTPDAKRTMKSIKPSISLIQVASKDRIAIFHISLYPSSQDLIAPSLRVLLENPDVTKAGVSIKGDCTRLRNCLGIKVQGLFELSHLHKLVKYCHSEPALINKVLVSLSQQVEEHFGLPLKKDMDVRRSDWSKKLTYDQVQYTADDAYACVRLFYAMDEKRKALDPTPPLPAHAELDIPIRTVHETTPAETAG